MNPQPSARREQVLTEDDPDVPMCDQPVTWTAAELGRILLDHERLIRERIARVIEREMQTPAADCGCPDRSKRNCGWRAGMGFAADVARDESRG